MRFPARRIKGAAVSQTSHVACLGPNCIASTLDCSLRGGLFPGLHRVLSKLVFFGTS